MQRTLNPLAGIVLKWVRGDKEANYRRAEPLIREAATHGARMVCTTECFLDGYAIGDKTIPLDQYRALGEPIPDGKYFQRLCGLARELGIHLVAGLLEMDGTNRFNTAVVIGPQGELLGRYHKQDLEHEALRNTAGHESPAIETPLISHVPHSQKAFEEAHKQGFKVVPYVHFTDIHSFYADQDVFLFEHPEILLKDEAGKWGHIPMDGSYRAFRYLTCANSPSYWKLCLDYVKKMMDWGADGVFIDNVGNRAPCMAPKFDVRNPEFPPFTHDHLFPDADHNAAFDRMLQAVRTLVKSYGEDKVVVLNSGIGTPFQKDGDCCVWESFIFSWAWEGRRDTWEQVKKKAKDNEWYQNSGRRIAALTTINRSRKSAKDDAFWAFAAARLVDFVWWASLSGTGAEKEDFKRRIDEWIRTFRKTKPAPGTSGPLIPGDPEREAERIRARTGVPLLKPVLQGLLAIAGKTGVSLELP